jgi:hypothetical protein
MHLSGGSECPLIVPFSCPLLQDVSAALYHRHYHYHPRLTHRLHYLGETATVALRLRALLTHCLHIRHSNFSRDTHSFCYIYAVPYHRSLPFPCNPFAARDASIIHATLLSEWNDLCCTPLQRVDHKSLRQVPPVSHPRRLQSPKIVVT